MAIPKTVACVLDVLYYLGCLVWPHRDFKCQSREDAQGGPEEKRTGERFYVGGGVLLGGGQLRRI